MGVRGEKLGVMYRWCFQAWAWSQWRVWWVARYDTTALSNKISTVGAGYQPARYAAMIVEGFRAGYYPAPYGFNGGNTIILHFGENQILDRKMLSPFSLSQ